MSTVRPRRKSFLVRCFINFVAILLVAKIVHGIHLDGIETALLGALVLGVVNAIIRPVLLLLSLPLTILTLGLFTFIVNALMLLLTAAILPGFTIAGFWTAVLAALLISVFSSVLSSILD